MPIISAPKLPGSLALLPEILQQGVIPKGVHRLQETLVVVGGKVAALSQSLELADGLDVQPTSWTILVSIDCSANTCSRPSRSSSVILVCIGQCLGPHIEQNSACL